MRRQILVAAALLASAGLAQAQSFGNSGVSGLDKFAPCALGTDDITQSLDCTIQSPAGISCSAGGINAGTQYLRRFDLNAEGLVSLYTVDAVQFGVEIEVPGSGFCAGSFVDVNVYSIAKLDPFTYANMTLEDGVVQDVAGTSGLIVTAPMNGTAVIDPSVDDLVVEVVTCNSADNGDTGQFFPGANDLGQTAPSYIASDACGISDPTDLASIGFPDSHDVFVVQGTESGGGCEGGFTEMPQARRRFGGGVDIRFGLAMTHVRATTTVPFYIELQDFAGNILATRTIGDVTLPTNERVELHRRMRLGNIPSGNYVLVAKFPNMKHLINFKSMIQIP